jgi:hypothetical protein
MHTTHMSHTATRCSATMTPPAAAALLHHASMVVLSASVWTFSLIFYLIEVFYVFDLLSFYFMVLLFLLRRLVEVSIENNKKYSVITRMKLNIFSI